MERNSLKKLSSIEELESYRTLILTKENLKKIRVRICMTGCRAYGAKEIKRALEEEIDTRGLGDRVEIISTGCHGFCARAPVMTIDPGDIFYQQVSSQDVPEIVSETLKKGKIVERLLYEDTTTGKRIVRSGDVPFYKKQTKNILRNCGRIDPTNISHYVARHGYAALGKVLGLGSPVKIIETVKRSDLRGRGGAGFPTGLKWSFAGAAKGNPKYFICNADEGDPGAFMDRALLEGDPHSVLEGMIIGGCAIGAKQGYIYVRAEYPIAIEHLEIAIRQAKELGFLGEDVLGSGFSFDIGIKQGAGAFVCGEETALIASIEGRRGMPRPRPPFPAQSGLWGRPTCINNVETLANVPYIFLEGADEYVKTGTEKSKGTKIFALAGEINNTGLVEVPMGTTLREVVFDIGGGVAKGRKFKAVQIGGPSGGCIPERYLDLPIDYDSLKGAGAIMGSGGMVVMDDNTCMVDIARFFLEFVQDESCGKCVPCRIGTKRMVEILMRITQGEGEAEDIEHLEELARMVKDASLCGLGQTAPNPVLSTLRYFRDECEAHIRDKKCPARVCRDLITYSIDREKCKGCLVCKKLCPEQAIEGKRKEPHRIDQAKCIKCGLCLDNCKFEAV
ncbi:NADH-quinone oxidoreductase subunit NuoF, partial [Candidatus Aerophobetes bacterium]